MKNFFEDYEKQVEQFNIDPNLLFNADETFVRKLEDHRKAARQKGEKQLLREIDDSSLDQEHRTILLFSPAHGETLKPLVIFPK